MSSFRTLALPLTLLFGAIACGPSEPDEPGTSGICAAANVACSPSVNEANQKLPGLTRGLGAGEILADSLGGVITGVGPGAVHFLDEDGVPREFRWVGMVPAGFQPGEPIVFARRGDWQMLRGTGFGLAVLITEEDSFDGMSAHVPPGGGPSVRYVPSCRAGSSTGVALRVDGPGAARLLDPGETSEFGEWTITHLGGLAEPRPSGDEKTPGSETPGSGGEMPNGGDFPGPAHPGDLAAGACGVASSALQEVRFRAAAIAVWRHPDATP
jgi:hypothetical protein